MTASHASQVLPRTPTAIRAAIAAAGQSDRFLWSADVPGFGLRARDGKASWVHQYRDGNGATRRLRLGAWPALSYADAFDAAQRNAARIALGDDPASERDTARAAAKGADKVGALFDRFLASPPRPWRPRTEEAVRYQIMTLCAPLHSKTTITLKAADVRDLLARIETERGVVTRNRTRSALASWSKWAAAYGFIEPEVAAGIAFLPKLSETARTRVPGRREIKALWHACGDDDYGRVVKLLAMTGTRRSEIAGLKVGEIDRPGKRITVAAERTKRGVAHDIPLTREVAALLPEPRPGRDHLFGEGPSDAPFSGWSQSWTRTWRRIVAAHPDMEPFTLHDLRRSASTWLHDRKEVEHVTVEAVLGHSVGVGSSAVYNRAAMLSKKRAALQLWQRQVAKWVAS